MQHKPQHTLRCALLLTGCLGAAWLTAYPSPAALADSSPAHSGSSSSGHSDSHSSSGSSSGHSDSHSGSGASSGSGAHTDSSKSSGSSGTPASSSGTPASSSGTPASSSSPSAPSPSGASHPAAPAPAAPPAARTLPDYGGRDGIAGTTYAASATPALNPLAQAWRAFEALAIVLALVVGGLYGLKRLGVIKPDGSAAPALSLPSALSGLLRSVKTGSPAPASDASPAWLTMLGSQTLPNAQGASLHLVSLGGKTLLIGATGQAVSLIAEVDAARPEAAPLSLDTGRMPASFDGFLMQADHAPQRQSNETELLMNATTMRLQAMIARSEG